MSRNARWTKAGYVLAGLVAGGVVAGAIGAQAATPSPSSTTSSSATTADPHPGDNGADGVPEGQEHHGGGGSALNLSGTVTAVGTNSVTIKTSTGTTSYSVTSSSDIDKNGEATLSKLAAGDAVTFGVSSPNAKQIDKLHAGDEAKNMPQHAGSDPTSSTSG